jgi:hypothetical protein
MAGSQMQRQSMQGALQNEFMKLKMDEMKKPKAPENPFAKINPKDFEPQSVATFQQTGNYADLKAVTPEGALGARELKIDDYQRTFGLSRERAVDLIDGNLSVTTSPNARGEITVTNRRTNESWQTSARKAQGMGLLPSGQGAQDSDPRVRTEGGGLPPMRPAQGVDDSVVRQVQESDVMFNRALSFLGHAEPSVQEGTGAQSAVKRGIDALAQAISFNTLPVFFAEEGIAADQIRAFNQYARGALVNNPRGPVWEQARVDEILPNPDKITTNPEQEAVKLLQVEQHLRQAQEANRAYVEGRQPRYIERRRLGTKVDPEVLPMGVPVEQADQVFPPGTVFVGPDGNTYEVY